MWRKVDLSSSRGCAGKWEMQNLVAFSKTDTEIEHRRPDIVIIDKDKRECKIIDVVVPGDSSMQRNQKRLKIRGSEIASAEAMEH